MITNEQLRKGFHDSGHIRNDVDMPTDADFEMHEARKRQLLVRARSVLRTLFHETSDALADPYRALVIQRLMDDITDFLDDGRPL
jgi:hypothetical protein